MKLDHSAAREGANNPNSCVLKLIVSSYNSPVNLFGLIVRQEPKGKALNPFFVGYFNNQKTLIKVFQLESNSLHALHDSDLFDFGTLQTIKGKLELQACVEGPLIIFFLRVVDSALCTLDHSQVFRLFDVTQVNHVFLSPCPEIRVQHYSIVIIRLGVKGNNLYSSRQKLQKIVVVTVNLCAFRIWSKPWLFCVIHNFLFWCFGYFSILHAWTFKRTRFGSFNTFRGLKQASDLNDFLDRQVWVLINFLVEFNFEIFVFLDPLEEGFVLCILCLREIGLIFIGVGDKLVWECESTRAQTRSSFLWANREHIGKAVEVFPFGFWIFTIVSELNQAFQIATRLYDYFAPCFRQLVKFIFVAGNQNIFWKLLPENVVHQVLVLAACVVLDWQNNRVMVFIVFQKLIDSLNRVSEWNRLAKPFATNSVSNHRLIVPLIMYVKLYALDSFLEVFNVPCNFAIACYLVSCQISVVRTEAKIIGQRKILINSVVSNDVVSGRVFHFH